MMEEAYNIDKPFEVLLLDLRMPVMDGFEVLLEYKKRGWILPHIIVVTASIMEEDRQKCKKIGVQYFINKPIEFQQLKNVILSISELL